jgi:DNA-binding GntR family transcriptional regulator
VTILIARDLDERFHERIMVLSGNDELLDRLRVINSRIRFIRWIVMEKARREKTQGEHQAIVEALAAKDGDLAASLISSHVGRRLDEIVEAVKLGYARIFLRDDLTVSPDN